MNLQWVEKELRQILADPDERYQAMMAISTDLCKALSQKPKPLPTTLLHARERGADMRNREGLICAIEHCYFAWEEERERKKKNKVGERENNK